MLPTGLNDGRSEEQVEQALLDIEAGRAANGEAWLARALPHHPVPGVVHVRAGQVYEAAERLPEAIAHYRQAVAIDPNEPAAHFVLGRALFHARHDDEALAELARAVPGPQEDTARRIHVLALARLGRNDEADRMMAALDPGKWDVDQARGFAAALADVGRIDLSLIPWRRAALAGGDARDYEQLGLAWVRLGRDAEAADAFAEAAGRGPALASAHLNYGVALAALGRVDEAAREARTALSIDPDYEQAKKFLAAIHR
jgi:tetratricopeptide (TPR) repeat protein